VSGLSTNLVAALPAKSAFDQPAPVDWRLDLSEPRRRRVRLWLWSIATMTAAVLVLGGITRLTHSGLSIVEWEPVAGIVPPLTEAQWAESFTRYQQFPEFQQLRRGMTIDEFKIIFLWEYAHRVTARLIGLVFLIPFAAFWLSGYFNRPLGIRAIGIFGLGAMQGVMGWLMVKSGLVDRPSVSHYRLAAHLSLAFLIFGACVWLARDLAIGPTPAAVAPRTRRLMARGLAIVGALLAAQIVWGALVAGLKAGFVYNTFPLMAGSIVSPNLLTQAPQNLVQNPGAVQWMHRLLGTVLLLASLTVFLQVRRSMPDRISSRLNTTFAMLIGAQYVLGVLTLIYVVPIPLAVMHQLAALAIAGVWVAWAQHVRHLRPVD
jgi:cytochrome c oxidase assembly protein subunit 15